VLFVFAAFPRVAAKRQEKHSGKHSCMKATTAIDNSDFSQRSINIMKNLK